MPFEHFAIVVGFVICILLVAGAAIIITWFNGFKCPPNSDSNEV